MATEEGTFGIIGIKVPPATNVKPLTKVIPYAPGMPLRYEITTLASPKDPVIQKQWTLFVLALERFKNLPVDNKLSFFQIAGIHGYPETVWDLSAAPKQDPQGEVPPGSQPFGGYCHHNTIAFPTWHRPYMLLYEVSLLCKPLTSY
jgi:tyrosinase